MTAALLVLALWGAQTPEPEPALRRLDRDQPLVDPSALKALPGVHPKSKTAKTDDGRGVIGEDGRTIVSRVVARGRALEDKIDYAEAFARFGVCTATHVGRGFFLTAGHCISQDPGYRGYRSAPCPAPLTLFDGRKVGCRVLTFAFDAKNDHALLRVDDPEALSTLPAFPVDYSFDWRRMRRREVMLYGLSGDELRVNASCTAVYERARKRVLHDCDTEGGDSGAALIDRRTQHIIAVHGGALPLTNYAWPIDQVPWAETLCIAVGSSGRLPVKPGAPPVRLRVSTSKMDGDFTRLVIDLDGYLYNRDLRLEVHAPSKKKDVEPREIRWSSGSRWWWRDLFILEEHQRGPWAVEVSSGAAPNVRRTGYVRGKIWVCP